MARARSCGQSCDSNTDKGERGFINTIVLEIFEVSHVEIVVCERYLLLVFTGTNFSKYEIFSVKFSTCNFFNVQSGAFLPSMPRPMKSKLQKLVPLKQTFTSKTLIG